MVFEMKLEDDKEWYKLPVDKVKEIAKMNSEGIKPESLAMYAITEKAEKIEKEKTEELVGQIDIKTLQKKQNKPKKQKPKTNQPVQKTAPTGEQQERKINTGAPQGPKKNKGNQKNKNKK